jgi:hypothetical protein
MFATPSFWAKWAYSSPEVEFQFKGWRINLDQDKTLDNPLSFKPDTTKVIRAYAEPKAPYFFQFKLNYEEGQMIASGKGLPCPKHVHNYCVLFFRAPGTSLWKSISRTILSILSSSFIAPFSYPQPTNYPAGEYLAIYYAAMPNNVTHTTIDEYQQYIPVAVSNIVQLMSAGMLGDVSGDGSITAYDAALTTMIALGMDVSGLGLPADYRARADVDGVAGVSLLDAALIAQRAVGLISRFPVEG